MIDVTSGGYYLYICIKPASTDSWVDHNGNTATQLGFSTRTPVPAILDGWSLANVFDVDLDVGEISRAFENFPMNPVERMADFSFSIKSIWSDPQGNLSTSNFLWMLEDIHRSLGKQLNLASREVSVWITTGSIPGLRYDADYEIWEQLGTPQTLPAVAAGLPIPAASEAAELVRIFRIEDIRFDGQGRISFSCTSRYGNLMLGSPVAFAGGDQKQIKPIIYGAFTDVLAPVAVEKNLDKVSRLHIEESSVAQFQGLMVYDKENDREWAVANATVRDGVVVDFTEDYDAAHNQTVRQENTDSWVLVDSNNERVLVCPSQEDPMQKLYRVNDEVVGFHTDKVTEITLGSTVYPPMVSRGWGDSKRASHAVGEAYKLVDAVLQENALLIDVELVPVRIYDASELNQQGNWNTSGGYNLLAPDGQRIPFYSWNCNDPLQLAGNPWRVIANSKNGGNIDNPIVVSTSNTDWNAYIVEQGYGVIKGVVRKSTEANLVFEFANLSGFGGTVLSAVVSIDVDAQFGEQVEWTGGDFENAWGTSYNGHTPLTIHADGDSPVVHHVFESASANSTGSISYADQEFDVGASISQVRLQCIMVASSQAYKPFFKVNGVKIKARLKIPITSDLKVCSKLLGRLASSGSAKAGAVVSDMLSRYLGASVSMSINDIYPVSLALTEQTMIRDVVRDVALAGGFAVVHGVSGFSLCGWGFSSEFVLDDSNCELATRNQPDVTYALPMQSSVVSSFELRYCWDSLRGKFMRSLIVTPDGYCSDGIWGDPSMFAYSEYGGPSMQGWCIQAKAWLGDAAASPLVWESKCIQDPRTAVMALERVMAWLTRPQITATVRADWSLLQGLDVMMQVQLRVSGVPARLRAVSWIVMGQVESLKTMERTITLVALQ